MPFDFTIDVERNQVQIDFIILAVTLSNVSSFAYKIALSLFAFNFTGVDGYCFETQSLSKIPYGILYTK